MTKALIAYFSATGTTERVAKSLAEVAGADLYEIKPEVPYSNEDLNWRNKQSRSSIEMNDPSYRPAIMNKDAHIEDYDVIFVGFPIWWYVAPTIINTFLESYDFSAKTIVPFATSGGSGMGQTVKGLKPSVADTALWQEGKLLNNNVSLDELSKWLKHMGLA